MRASDYKMTDKINSIKIGPYDYKVKRIKNLTDGEGVSLYGQITYSDAIIRIEKSVSNQRQGASMVHEAIHGILEHSGLDETDEKIVIVLGNGLFQLIRDNPDMIKYIQSLWLTKNSG